MANIGDLVAYLKADTKNFDRNLMRSARNMKTFSDRTLRGMKAIRASIATIARPLTSIHGQLLALASVATIGIVSKSFLNASRESENFRLRLNALLGSTEEGGRMFKEMSKFAGEVPFAYRDIMSSATQLSGVMRGGVEEVQEWMPLIADLAAVSGLGIEKTTEQVVRMYSAGAASADLFRERGITAMLGFQSGVQYSANETRTMLMNAWKDPQSKFKDATKDMAMSWDGLMSMIGDKWFQFRNLIMDAGVFDAMKEKLSAINKYVGEWLKDNAQLIKQKVPEYLDKLSKAAKIFLGFLKYIIDAVRTLWTLLSALPKGFLDYLESIAERADEAEQKIADLNETVAQMEAPPLTSWQKMWDWLGGLGKNIIDVFAMAFKAAGTSLAFFAGSIWEFVSMAGKQFYNLADIISKAMTLDFAGAKAAYSRLVRTNDDYVKQIVKNWEGYEKAIYDGWEQMLVNMENRMYGPPPDPKEYVDSWMRNMSRATLQGPKIAPPAPPKDWEKHWKEYWNTLQGNIEMSKALASSTENLHEEWRLLNTTLARPVHIGVDYSELEQYGEYIDSWMMKDFNLEGPKVITPEVTVPAADSAQVEADMKAFHENVAKTAKEMTDVQKAAYSEMYDTLRWKAEGYFEYRKQAILDDALALQEASGNSLLAQEYLHERMIELLGEQREAHSQLYESLMNMSQRTAEAIEQTFSDLIYDFLQGELKTWQDYVRAFGKALSRITADILGQMIKDFLMGAIKKKAAMAMEAAQVQMLTQMYYALAMAKAAAGMGGGFGVGKAGQLNFYQTGRMIAGMEKGGPVQPNQPFLVGEKGPELFVPDVSGKIIPENKVADYLGGGFSLPPTSGSEEVLKKIIERTSEINTMKSSATTMIDQSRPIVAMKDGGVINELIHGIGQKTGSQYMFGEGGKKEFVVPESSVADFIGGGSSGAPSIASEKVFEKIFERGIETRKTAERLIEKIPVQPQLSARSAVQLPQALQELKAPETPQAPASQMIEKLIKDVEYRSSYDTTMNMQTPQISIPQPAIVNQGLVNMPTLPEVGISEETVTPSFAGRSDLSQAQQQAEFNDGDITVNVPVTLGSEFAPRIGGMMQEEIEDLVLDILRREMK